MAKNGNVRMWRDRGTGKVTVKLAHGKWYSRMLNDPWYRVQYSLEVAKSYDELSPAHVAECIATGLGYRDVSKPAAKGKAKPLTPVEKQIRAVRAENASLQGAWRDLALSIQNRAAEIRDMKAIMQQWKEGDDRRMDAFNAAFGAMQAYAPISIAPESTATIPHWRGLAFSFGPPASPAPIPPDGEYEHIGYAARPPAISAGFRQRLYGGKHEYFSIVNNCWKFQGDVVTAQLVADIRAGNWRRVDPAKAEPAAGFTVGNGTDRCVRNGDGEPVAVVHTLDEAMVMLAQEMQARQSLLAAVEAHAASSTMANRILMYNLALSQMGDK